MPEEQIELTSETSGNFLIPVTEQFTKIPFDLDQLVSTKNFKLAAAQSLQDTLDAVNLEISDIDEDVAKARAGGAKTSAEIEAEKPVQNSIDQVLPPTPVDGQTLSA